MTTAVTISPTPILQFFNNNGQPNVGGTLLTQVGGVNYVTYQDSAGTIPLPNPIPLNSRGEVSNAAGTSCELFLVNGVTYTFTLFDASGNQLNQSSYVSPYNVAAQFTAFSAALAAQSVSTSSGASLIGFIQPAITGAPVGRTVQSKLTDIISVLDFGANPTASTDQSAYFNFATQGGATWSTSTPYDIFVPSGPNYKYIINNTVYVRGGQTIRGSGHGTYINASGSTTSPAFYMGAGLVGATFNPGSAPTGGTLTQDSTSTGLPVRVSDMYIYGGPGGMGVITCNYQGFSITNMFLSVPGIGIALGISTSGAADGIISSVEIDQPLTGISMQYAQNIQIVGVNMFLNPPSIGLLTTGVVFNSNCRDINFTGGGMQYMTSCGVLFNTSATGISGINFTGVNFTSNVQYSASFIGFVNCAAGGVDAQFNGCSFRNMYSYAVVHGGGTAAVELTFKGCVFDGAPTYSGYAASTTAAVLYTVGSGGNGTYTFDGCSFRNLFGSIALVNLGTTRLTFKGGEVINCDANATSQQRFNVIGTAAYKIRVKGVSGFPYVTNNGTQQYCVLPYWGAATVWKVAIKGNTQTSGDSFYGAAEEAAYPVSWQNASGTKSIYVDKVLLWATPARTNPGQLGAVACLGNAPGGPASNTTFAAVGQICVSVATTSPSNFDFYAETGT